MATQNNFKSTAVCGIFTNSDYPDGSILANGTFNRDLHVKGNLYLGTETGTIGAYVDTGANINFSIGGVVYTVTPAILQILISLSSQTLATQTYVNNQISALVSSAPATLDTLNELAAALGNDANFSATTATNIASKVSKSGNEAIAGIKTFNINPECSIAPTTGNQLINKNYCDGTFATLANNCDNTTLQTITGQKTFSSTSNVYYGSGANLTGIVQTLPTNITYTDTLQTITGQKTFSNTANSYYGHGSNLSNVNSSKSSIITTGLGINQVVPLVNTQTATPGNYQLNIATDNNNNMRFNNTTGALTCNYYYGDGSNLSGLVSGVVLTSLGLNQVVPLINTQTATAGNYALNIGASYNNNMLFNNTTGALTCTYYYGDGSNLTGVLKTLPTNLMKTDVTQLIVGINTFNNASNIFYGDGSNLTGVLKTLPTNVMKTDSIQIVSALNTFNTVPICATNCSTSTQLANKAYVDSVIPVMTNYDTLNTAQTITADKTYTGNIIMSDGGTNTTTIDQAGHQLNIINSMYNTNVTTITGLVLASNPTTLIRTDSVIMPTIQGCVTGDNINNLYTNNCLIYTVTTGGIYMSSNYPTMGLDFVVVSATYPIGTMITSNIGTYFSVGTYVIANAPAGYIQFNKPLLAAIVKITVTTNLITLTKGIIGGALLGNVYIDYTPTTNIQINTASTVTQNAISIKATGMNIGIPTTYNYAPVGVNDIVNKAYADSIIASSINTVTTNTDQAITGIKVFGSCLYGRNDGFTFNAVSLTGVNANLYPIGYCWEILGALSTPTTGSNYAGIAASPALGIGVWAISGYMVINKGTGAYLAASIVSVLWDTVAGVRIYPASSGMIYPLLAANTAAKYVIPLGTINVVVTTAGAIQTITRMISCTIGTLTWQVSFTGVKIA